MMRPATTTAEVLRELDAKCVADQVTRAELARRSRAPAQTVRRLLTVFATRKPRPSGRGGSVASV